MHWSQVPNPLTQFIPLWDSLEQISEALSFDPIVGLDVSRLTLVQRHQYLVAEKMPLKPTSTSLEAALTMIGMQRSSLEFRNPTLVTGRRQTNETIEAALGGANFFGNGMPAPGACFLVMQGILGTAKTVTAKLTCRSLLGPKVVRLPPDASALFNSARQLLWLYVGMSHDGSRGGLLNSIILEIDRTLGTNYIDEMLKKYKSVEKLSGAVIGLLHTLCLGILIIDEIQLLNLVTSEHAQKMQLFLLNLISSGIPVVFVGNPLGFTWLEKFAQNLSRAIERSPIFFHPCGAIGLPEYSEWGTVYAGVRPYYVLPKPPHGSQELFSSTLEHYSGGIPRPALTLWCTAQSNALLDGKEFITVQDIDDAYNDESFSKMREICAGFANKDPIPLSQWSDCDIPVEYYARHWGKALPKVDPTIIQSPSIHENSPATSNAAPQSTKPTPRKTQTEPRSGKSAFKAQQTREANADALRRSLSQSLPQEDMRMLGVHQHTLKSFEAMMAGITRKKDGKN